MDKAVFSPRANIRYNPTQDVNIDVYKRQLQVCLCTSQVDQNIKAVCAEYLYL